MNEKIYFISDIEMGGGGVTDDFSDDLVLAEFLESIKNDVDFPDKDQKVTLVLNGDTFDFLKMPYQDEHPRYITERISLWKLDQVMNAHPVVFRALKKFLHHHGSRIHFVIGNHDADLIWPALQEKLQARLGGKKRVSFGFSYKNHKLHAEHGHLEDPFFAINRKKPVINYRGLKILNLSWGAGACFSHLLRLKKQFPREECFYPKPLALKQNPAFHSLSKKTTANLALKSLLLDPIAHPLDPTYHVPYLRFLKHLLKFGFNFVDDEKLLKAWTGKIIKSNPGNEIFIFGHAHVLTDTPIKGKRVLITDTWRNEINLLQNGQKKPKTYAMAHFIGGRLVDASLKQFTASRQQQDISKQSAAQQAPQPAALIPTLENNHEITV
ncbi:hypothetical protein KKH03_04565 [Patescibacteria group bacterium]|nr:hypothetical protein [Patescibacteria group bacterium]